MQRPGFYRKRMEVKVAVFLYVFCALALPCNGQKDAYNFVAQLREEWPFPELPYAYDALEPHLDEATMRVHHQGHLKAYTAGMNKAMRAWADLVRTLSASLPLPPYSLSLPLDAGAQAGAFCTRARARLHRRRALFTSASSSQQWRRLSEPYSLFPHHVSQ